jgi:cAMP-dependent protein kinase regulator
MSTTVPTGLTELLEEFAVAVLKDKPSDLVEFAADYFENLRRNRTGPPPSTLSSSSHARPAPTEQMESDIMSANTAGIEVQMSSYDDQDDDDNGPSSEYMNAMAYRRRSIFAESYIPGSVDVEKIVHPKSDDQRQRLITAVQKIFIFKALDQEQLNEILDAMFEKKVAANEVIIEQGDDGDNFYVIDNGQYQCLQVPQGGGEQREVFRYDNEGFFGELALMYNTPRAATVVSVTPGILWALDRQTFKRILCESASKKRETYKTFLESVPMLQSLESYELLNLADALERRYYNDGDIIIKQGDQADNFYIVESGNVDIARQDASGASVFLNTLTSGGYFGGEL